MQSTVNLPRILTVDDRAENLMAYDALLEEVQCEVIACNSGMQALDYLKNNEIALILLDVQMPIMDGFETAKRIRDMPQHATTPILFVTAIDHDRQHVLRAARLKVADVIYKPIDVEIFLAKIQIFLDLYEAKQFKKIQTQTYFLEAPGEVAQQFRDKNWADTPLGPIENWPLSLKTMVGVMLNSKFPKYIAWGPERILLYNDAYTALLADKHPRALGKPFEAVWGELLNELGSMLTQVEAGKSFYFEDRPLEVYRNGHFESGFFTFSFSPIRNDFEQVGGILCTVIETTGQIKTRNEIAESERTLDQIFSESPSFMAFLTAPDYVFQKVNNEYLKLVGLNDILGKSVLDVMPEVEAQGFLNLLDKVATTKKPFYGNEVLIDFSKADGKPKRAYLDFVYQPLINSQGEVHGIVAQGFDVTEKVLARKQVEESEAFLKLITDSIPDFISYIGADEKYQFVNPAYENWFNIKTADILGKSFQEVVGDTYYKKSEPFIRRGLNGESVNFESELKNAQGEIKKISVSYVPDRDSQNNVLGVVVVGHDVTAIREANERLSKIQAISSNLTKSLTIKDIVKVIVEQGVPAINAASGVVCLLDEDEVHLNMVHSLGYPEDIINKYERIKLTDNFPLCEAFNTKKPIVIQPEEDLQQRYPGLSLLTDLHKSRALIAFPIMIRERVLGVIGITYNRNQKVDQNTLNIIQTLTELVGQAIDRAEVYEKEIIARKSAEVAKDEAERANVLKSAFLANMSHEIRTPLGAMIGFADLLRDPRISQAEHSSYIDIMVRNGEQLSVIINDILDLSKVEAGHLTLEYVEANPDIIAAEVVSLLKLKAKEKGLELVYTSDASTPRKVISDPTRMRQILLNLVGNAIKFTHTGGVYITSHGHKTTQGSGCITYEIRDTGIGIPENQRENVFEMFVQADGSMTRRFGGTGLGLALSRRLARALGGDVKVKESVVGGGSTFSVTIEDHPERQDLLSKNKSMPIKESDEPLSTDALKNVSVLVVDDAPDNQFLIRNFLSKRGAKVDSAENGLDGFQKAISGRYDVILMDIQMPVMDGYTATQKLRDHGYKKPIIALTAHAMTEVARKCLNVGCTDHLSKPIDSLQLIRTIARHSSHH